MATRLFAEPDAPALPQPVGSPRTGEQILAAIYDARFAGAEVLRSALQAETTLDALLADPLGGMPFAQAGRLLRDIALAPGGESLLPALMRHRRDVVREMVWGCTAQESLALVEGCRAAGGDALMHEAALEVLRAHENWSEWVTPGAPEGHRLAARIAGLDRSRLDAHEQGLQETFSAAYIALHLARTKAPLDAACGKPGLSADEMRRANQARGAGIAQAFGELDAIFGDAAAIVACHGSAASFISVSNAALDAPAQRGVRIMESLACHPHAFQGLAPLIAQAENCRWLAQQGYAGALGLALGRQLDALDERSRMHWRVWIEPALLAFQLDQAAQQGPEAFLRVWNAPHPEGGAVDRLVLAGEQNMMRALQAGQRAGNPALAQVVRELADSGGFDRLARSPAAVACLPEVFEAVAATGDSALGGAALAPFFVGDGMRPPAVMERRSPADQRRMLAACSRMGAWNPMAQLMRLDASAPNRANWIVVSRQITRPPHGGPSHAAVAGSAPSP